MRVENPNIKESLLKPTTPETIGSKIKSCTILGVGRRTMASEYLTINGLQVWFNANIIANFCEHESVCSIENFTL